MRSIFRLICALNVIGKIVNIFIVKNRFRLKVQWKGCKVQCACITFKLQITPSLIQIILGAIQSVLFMSLSLRIAPKNSLAWFPHILSTIWVNTVYIFFNWLSGCLLLTEVYQSTALFCDTVHYKRFAKSPTEDKKLSSHPRGVSSLPLWVHSLKSVNIKQIWHFM